MKEITIREMRASLGRLDQILDEEGELLLTRHGKTVARLLPVSPKRRLPSHRDLRERMSRVGSSAELVRADRDDRG